MKAQGEQAESHGRKNNGRGDRSSRSRARG
jgi:hypothetical protein